MENLKSKTELLNKVESFEYFKYRILKYGDLWVVGHGFTINYLLLETKKFGCAGYDGEPIKFTSPQDAFNAIDDYLNLNDEMQNEYDLHGGIRGKYADRFSKGISTIEFELLNYATSFEHKGHRIIKHPSKGTWFVANGWEPGCYLRVNDEFRKNAFENGSRVLEKAYFNSPLEAFEKLDSLDTSIFFHNK